MAIIIIKNCRSVFVHVFVHNATKLKRIFFIVALDGLKFFISKNNVILCPGNENGYLETKYFAKAVNVKSGQPLC